MVDGRSVSGLLSRLLLLHGFLLFLAGCSSSPRFAGRSASSPEPPEPSAYHSYKYLAITDDCRCETFETTDRGVEYHFRASYKMYNGILTDIEIEIKNHTNDTLFLEHATAKVTSRNIPYMYNDMFLPLPVMNIPPGSSNVVNLSGKDRTGENDWHKIAGEQLVVTMQGLHAGDTEVAAQSVTFVPENPMMEK